VVAPDTQVLRGQIWYADLGVGENKRVLVVSNNTRQRQLGDVVAIRLTSKDKPDLPSIVRFEPHEMPDRSRSYALADDLWVIEKRWLERPIGGLTPGQMERVSAALRVALDL
jgi:mRNA interferase MazF